MKKLFYSFAIITLAFASCNPMDDIYKEIDAKETVIAGDATITLTDDDYKLSGNDDVTKNKSFTGYTQAETIIPTILTAKYPVWKKNSTAKVSFAIDRLNYLNAATVYEVTEADYLAQNHTYKNYDSPSDIIDFLKWKYPNAGRGDVIELTYKYYSGSVSTLTNKFIMTDEWIATKSMASADYTAMGQRFSNFDNFGIAEFKIGRYLATLPDYNFSKDGDVVNVVYTYTYKDGSTRKFKSVLASYTFNSGAFELISNSIKFGHNGTKWEKDNTIKYTLTAADYALVGNSRYGNFDVRSGKNEEKEDVRIGKISQILLNNFPNDAEGQKYLVSYNIYNGSNGVWTLAVIKKGTEYVKQ